MQFLDGGCPRVPVRDRDGARFAVEELAREQAQIDRDARSRSAHDRDERDPVPHGGLARSGRRRRGPPLGERFGDRQEPAEAVRD